MTTLPRGAAFTRPDLEAMLDDGRRHELVDGTLVVTPAPTLDHQRMVGRLFLLLTHARPPELEVLLAPFDVALAEDTVVQPDLLVARRDDLTERDLPAAPMLAVEVASPSTRRIDRHLKRSRYEAAGCPAYWVAEAHTPSVTVWELEEGRYVERAALSGEQEYAARAPFAVRVCPAELTG